MIFSQVVYRLEKFEEAKVKENSLGSYADLKKCT